MAPISFSGSPPLRPSNNMTTLVDALILLAAAEARVFDIARLREVRIANLILYILCTSPTAMNALTHTKCPPRFRNVEPHAIQMWLQLAI